MGKIYLIKPNGFDKKESVCLSTPDKEKGGKETPIDIFEVESANDTMKAAQKMQIPNMLFGELIFEKELTILFSSAGIGKTMLAVQIADHISRGKSFGTMKNE